jgi:class 3 adenylate cyclase/pimeloyl-ACP methyl ester carboxylesterase
MEPRIQYARTSDGVSIAYFVIGSGLPFVHMPDLIGSHVALEARIPVARSWLEALAQNHQVVRYDIRGMGLSDRVAPDYSPRGRLLDLEAVSDHLQLETFVLMGGVSQALVAIEYAVKHPDRISNLILWCPYARAADYLGIAEVKGFVGLIEADWEMFTESLARARVLGWSSGDEAHRLAQQMRETCTQEVARAAFEGLRGHDVTPQLRQIKVPTLVLHRRRITSPNMELGRSVAAQIPGAQFVVVEGAAAPPYVGHADAVAKAIGDFLGESITVREGAGTTSAAAVHLNVPTGMTAILFADIADSTVLTERLGDTAFREKARGLDSVLRGVITESGGTPIEGKLLGDGVLAVFTSARHAMEAALACATSGNAAGLPLHLGLHAGDVIREDNNVYGGAVNIASRIAGLSAAGEVLVSETVRSLARTSAGVRFEDRGRRRLKGVGETLRVWAVREVGE